MEENKDTTNANDKKDSHTESENGPKGKIKNKFESKENESYVNELPDGDLKYFLEYECKSETLVAFLQAGRFRTMGSIQIAYATMDKLTADAKKEGFNVGLADKGSIGRLYEKLQQSDGMNKSKTKLSFGINNMAGFLVFVSFRLKKLSKKYHARSTPLNDTISLLSLVFCF